MDLSSAVRAALAGNMEAQRQLTTLAESDPNAPSLCLEALAARVPRDRRRSSKPATAP